MIQYWWQLFNAQQAEAGGDPFIGRKLLDLAHGLSARDIEATTIKPVSSTETPARRIEFLDYLEELFISGAENLQQSALITPEMLTELRSEFTRAKADPTAQCEYHGVRLICSP